MLVGFTVRLSERSNFFTLDVCPNHVPSRTRREEKYDSHTGGLDWKSEGPMVEHM